MYEDKLKKELIKKMSELQELEKMNLKISKTAHKEVITEKELKHLIKIGTVCFDIDELLLETRYLPLTSMSYNGINTLVKYADRHEPEDHVNTEKHIEMRLLQLKEEWGKRLRKTKTLFLKERIDLHTHHLYNQAVRAYYYGLFESCCVLCRAISESIVKKYICNTGSGNLLAGKTYKDKRPSLRLILEKEKTPKYLLVTYEKIARKANGILHIRKTEIDDSALESIRLLQILIKGFVKLDKEIPKTPR